MRIEESFSASELPSSNLIALGGDIIFSTRDPTSVVEDLPPNIKTNVIPDLLHSTAAVKRY
jgi:hypothetical protein